MREKVQEMETLFPKSFSASLINIRVFKERRGFLLPKVHKGLFVPCRNW